MGASSWKQILGFADQPPFSGLPYLAAPAHARVILKFRRQAPRGGLRAHGDGDQEPRRREERCACNDSSVSVHSHGYLPP